MKLLTRWCLLIAALCQAGCSLPKPGRGGMVIRDFSYPWSPKAPPRTSFTAGISGDRWRFQFEVEDHDIVTATPWRGESTLDDEDRVEIFLARDPELNHYYCIEIDSLGRVHDYAASFYRRFDSKWNCPGLLIATARTASGYRVAGSIPLESLTAVLGTKVEAGTSVLMGVFRAEFRGTDQASHGAANDNWISWWRPASKTPDFHVPSAFKSVKF